MPPNPRKLAIDQVVSLQVKDNDGELFEGNSSQFSALGKEYQEYNNKQGTLNLLQGFLRTYPCAEI